LCPGFNDTGSKPKPCPKLPPPCPTEYTFTRSEVYLFSVLLLSVILALALFLGILYTLRVLCKDYYKNKARRFDPDRKPKKSILKKKEAVTTNIEMEEPAPPNAPSIPAGASASTSFAKKRGVDLPSLYIPPPPPSSPFELCPPRVPTPIPAPRRIPPNLGAAIREHRTGPAPLRRPTTLPTAPRVRHFASLGEALARVNIQDRADILENSDREPG
jgi:hypothetical protein